MVSDKILSRFQSSPPTDWTDDRDRAINSGPLYPLIEVEKVISDSNAIRPSTSDCRADIQELALDTDDLSELLRKAIRVGKYRNSVWCRLGKKAIAACDAYVVRDKAWVEAAHKEMECEYYFKFAINATGKLLLMVSCHLSN
tara:strand:+ start:2242 stop:2667 length:426 start_codon:yes stop_codon:yes gene_type:complete